MQAISFGQLSIRFQNAVGIVITFRCALWPVWKAYHGPLDV